MDRRSFLIKAGVAFPVISGALYVTGCDSDSNGGTDDNGQGNNDGGNNDGGNNSNMVITATSSTVAGHSHNASIPESDLDSTISQSYTTSSDGGHSHTVILSAAQLESLSNNTDVSVSSSNDSGHSHTFTFSKVG